MGINSDVEGKRVLNKVIVIITLLIVVVGTIILEYKFDIFGLMKENNNDTLRIDKTALIIEETKKISEFTSAQYYEDAVITKTRKDKGLILDTDNELVVITYGCVRAGFDLSKIDDKNLVVNGDSISIILPKVEIFDVIINPSNYEIFVEDGTWSHEEVTEAVLNAKTKLESDAITNGILENATKSGISKLTELYKSFGFSYVNVKLSE